MPGFAPEGASKPLRLAVLTSGGDAPGMNSAIRAVVRKAAYHGHEVIGVRYGFEGLMKGDFIHLGRRDVGDIIHRGGTILRSARADRFLEREGQQQAMAQARQAGITGLIAIGGNGTLRGTAALSRLGLAVCFIPASIDNDVPGTTRSIGFDTAVNTIVEAVNRIRDTATSHERVFVIEVMGRASGALALHAGVASGAESILIPELPTDYEEICRRLKAGLEAGKAHSIIIVAEGAGGGYDVARQISARTGLETRVTVLGHIQRGGTPSASDRLLASRLGVAAVDCLREGKLSHVVGIHGDAVRVTPIVQTLREPVEADLELARLATILSM